MKNRIATWVSINLGDATDSGSDSILRYALGGIDIEHEGNTYLADGNLVSIGDVDQRLGFRKTHIKVTLNSTNLTNLGLVNQYKYRNKPIEVFFAARNEDGSIDTNTITQTFGGQCDSHDVSRKQITIKGVANFGRFEQVIGARTSVASQDEKIAAGVYGPATTAVDTGFKYADQDFGDLKLGVVASKTTTTYTEVVGERRYFGLFGPKNRTQVPNTVHIPGRSGASLSDTGQDYTRPVIFGRANSIGTILYGFNPTQERIDAVYPSLNHDGFIKDTADGTKYITFVVALGEGEFYDLSAIWTDLGSGATTDTFAMKHNGIGTVKNSDGQVVVIVETKLGTYTQTACSNLIALSPVLTNTFRCLGTGYAVVTAIASDIFGENFPQAVFQVGGKGFTTITRTGS